MASRRSLQHPQMPMVQLREWVDDYNIPDIQNFNIPEDFDLQPIKLRHVGKREVLGLIDLLEGCWDELMLFDPAAYGLSGKVPTDRDPQQQHGVQGVVPKKPPQNLIGTFTVRSQQLGFADQFKLKGTEAYLKVNSDPNNPLILFGMKSTGNCLFHAVKGCMKIRTAGDKEAAFFPCRYLCRLIVNWMCHNRCLIWKHKKVSLMSKYGVEGGDVVENPISFKEYLRSMLSKKFWGEDIVLYALSCMYDLKITVLQAQSLHEFRFRHNQPLSQVDMVLVYVGSNHYLYAIPVNKNGEKMVLTVDSVRVSKHKDICPEDSNDLQDIGLSSEEEAEGLEEMPHIWRKYHSVAYTSTTQPPAPEPEPTPTTSTGVQATTSTDPATATVQVPVEALQQVHDLLGSLISGQPIPSLGSPPAPTGPAPFPVPKPKVGEKECKICFRKFWATDTLKKHLKTHTGEQKNVCPNPGCGRKLTSKRTLEEHLQTCQKEKTLFCSKKGCKKLFSTLEGLSAHKRTHKSLKEGEDVCKGCGKDGFTKKKSLDDHYRTCLGNPDRVGPFPCPVPGCKRAQPSRSTMCAT